ncbi:dTDP-4-dehydrorhamnose reductase [Microbulbifer hainanensis]|uniref:dTDP-4-dehydrorhamnose reductase n=1 Tax=Microbulbifer hainanensis TaxID=2735675 RepID=UPI001866A48B|nr:dTDP-4-dehydrorhamnose reductase [Microbulbifer hainanensis]
MSAEERRALVFGKNGQLAQELVRTLPAGWSVAAMGREEVDLLDPASVADAIGSVCPNLVINAAAYTAVDKAESEEAEAFALNQKSVEYIAGYLKDHSGCPLIHLSTDFVFDGKQSHPYSASDPTNPLNVYGASKLAGERAIMDVGLPNSLIIRTSWVYSCFGQNFVKTMLRLMADPARHELSVIYDQIGTPTWARSLAEAVWTAGLSLVNGQEDSAPAIFHWSDAGVASWYDFAIAIQELAYEREILKRKIPVKPIPHTDYPLPAARPAFSVMDKSAFERTFDFHTKHWRAQLAAMLDELKIAAEQNS